MILIILLVAILVFLLVANGTYTFNFFNKTFTLSVNSESSG